MWYVLYKRSIHYPCYSTFVTSYIYVYLIQKYIIDFDPDCWKCIGLKILAHSLLLSINVDTYNQPTYLDFPIFIYEKICIKLVDSQNIFYYKGLVYT